MPTSTAATLTTVRSLKESLVKELPAEDDSSIERCRDILTRLDECSIDLSVLTETMIGVTVNKLKSHKDLGDTVKKLVKKWKKIANTGDSGSQKPNLKRSSSIKSTTSTKSTASASASLEQEDTYNPQLEWSGLPNHRTNICKKLHDIMMSHKDGLIEQGVNKSVVIQLVGPRTAEVENAMHEFAGNTMKKYTDKARSICFNLKKNKKLTINVLLGHIDAEALVNFSSEELASDDIQEKRAEAKKKLIDSKRLDWDTANEDKINKQCGISGDLLNASLFTCGRCKSIKTTSTQKQTRSADEPMTVFVLCLNCGNRWKC